MDHVCLARREGESYGDRRALTALAGIEVDGSSATEVNANASGGVRFHSRSR